MPSEKKRKHHVSAGSPARENEVIEPPANLHDDKWSGGPSSLTSTLFGGPPAVQNDLFSSTIQFDSAVRDRIVSNKHKQASCRFPPNTSSHPSENVQTTAKPSRETILSRRKKQASSSFLCDITSIAPIPVDFERSAAVPEGVSGGLDDNVHQVIGGRIPQDVCVEEIADTVRLHGFAVVKNAVSKNLLYQLAMRAKEIENQVCERLDDRNVAWIVSSVDSDNGEETQTFRFHEVASRCKGRMDIRYRISEEPFTSSDILENPSLLPIVQSLLGAAIGTDTSHAPVLLYAGLILSFVDSDDQPWHQDGMPLFPELSPADAMLPPYAINVFVPLTDLDGSMEAGPTEFIPGSHVLDEEVVLERTYCSDGKQSSTQVDSQNGHEEQPNIMSPILMQGDALLYDYRVCHRGTSNLADSNQTRRILYLMYARPWFKEHLNFGSERLFPEERR